MASFRVVARALALTCLVASPALADAETQCRRDADGHLICVKVEREKPKEKCTLTCRKDAAGKTICRERCR